VKKTLMFVVLFGLLITNLSWADWPMFQRDTRHTGRANIIAAQTNNLKWQLDLGVNISPYGGPSVGLYNGSRRIVVGTDDGVYVIDTSGFIFEHISTGFPVETVVAIYNNTLYFGAGDTLYAYQPSGLYWSQPLDDNDLTHVTIQGDTIYVCDEDRLWSFSLSGDFYWMSDNLSGNIIYAAPAVDQEGNVYVVSSQALWDDYVLYAYRSNGNLWWSYDYLAFEGNGVQMTPTLDREGNVYLATYWSSFWPSSIQSLKDGDRNWKHSAEALHSSPAYHNGVIYYGTTEGLEARSSDGTLLWAYYTPSAVKYSSPAIGRDGTIYIGTEGGRFLAITNSGGAKWSSDVLQSAASSPAIDENGVVYVAAGQSLFAFADSTTDLPPDNSNLAAPTHIFIYPNPFNSSAKISYYLTEAGWVKIDLYDIRGSHIKALANQPQDKGQHQVSLSGLSSGIYFVRFKTNNYSHTKRATVIK